MTGGHFRSLTGRWLFRWRYASEWYTFLCFFSEVYKEERYLIMCSVFRLHRHLLVNSQRSRPSGVGWGGVGESTPAPSELFLVSAIAYLPPPPHATQPPLHLRSLSIAHCLDETHSVCWSLKMWEDAQSSAGLQAIFLRLVGLSLSVP